MFKTPFFWSDYRFDRPSGKTLGRCVRVWEWVWKIGAGWLLITIFVLLLLRWVPPPTTSFMLQSSASHAAIRYQWVAGRKISGHALVAVVAAEDQKFPDHWGFDFDAIGSALEENQHRKRPRGASTISQQVAKNLFLWSGRSYLRKALEAYFTVMIEFMWPKQRILEVYLNIAQFGPGVFGVEAASRHYFGKSAARLDRFEAALLAAVLPNPIKLYVPSPSDYVQQRAWQIEAQMEQLGGLGYLKGIWTRE